MERGGERDPGAAGLRLLNCKCACLQAGGSATFAPEWSGRGLKGGCAMQRLIPARFRAMQTKGIYL